MDPESFFDGLYRWFSEDFFEDAIFQDLLEWMKYNVKTINYNPDYEREFVVAYNWETWIRDENWQAEPQLGLYRYVATDKTYSVGEMEFPIDWHLLEQEQKTEFLILSLANQLENIHKFKELIPID